MVFALVRGRLGAGTVRGRREQLGIVAILVAAIFGGKFVRHPIAHDPHPLAGPAAEPFFARDAAPECFRELAKQTNVRTYFIVRPLYVR